MNTLNPDVIVLVLLWGLTVCLTLASYYSASRPSTRKTARAHYPRRPVLVVAGDFDQFRQYCDDQKLSYHYAGSGGEAIYIRQPYMMMGYSRGTRVMFIGTFWEHGDFEDLLQRCKANGYVTNLAYTSIWGPPSTGP
jgi:hypothetical protein